MRKVVEVRNVSKHYGQIVALDNISLDLHAGEIVAILGDNGAGKSTLMNIMCGALSATRGEVVVNGRTIQSLRQAQESGVGVVYQDLALAPHLSVAENLFLGREQTASGPGQWVGWLDRQGMREAATQAIRKLGVSTLRDVRMPVGRLSGGQRQVTAIARAMMWTKVAILLDEPTAALGPKQVALVLDSIRAAAAHDLAVCIIAHDIPHILQIADRLAFLHHGRLAKIMPAAGLSVTETVALMVGE